MLIQCLTDCCATDGWVPRLRARAASDVEAPVIGEEVESRMGVPQVDAMPPRENFCAEEQVVGNVLQWALSGYVSPMCYRWRVPERQEILDYSKLFMLVTVSRVQSSHGSKSVFWCFLLPCEGTLVVFLLFLYNSWSSRHKLKSILSSAPILSYLPFLLPLPSRR